MAGTDEGWDEGPATAIAGAAYSDAIAKSDPDFESEAGTAVAPQDYVETARKASASEASDPAPLATPAHAKGQRAPTMAFGTPAMLRAPAQTPAAALPTTRPATARTPGGGLPGVPREVTPRPRTPAPGVPARKPDLEETADAIPSPVRARPSQQVRKPAPSPFVDQVYDSPSGATRQSRPSKPIAIEGVEERSGPLARQPRISQRFDTEADVAEPPPPEPLDDDGAEDDSASDIDAFDNAETMGQMRRSVPMAIPSRPTPAPLAPSRPTPAPLAPRRPTPAPMNADPQAHAMGAAAMDAQAMNAQAHAMPTRASSPMPAYQPSVDPHAATVQAMPALVPPVRPSLTAQASAALPTAYPVMTADTRASYMNPLSAPALGLTKQEPALVEKPRRRGLVIGGIVLAVVASGIAGFLLFGGGNGKPTAAAATTNEPVKATPTEKAPSEPAAITAKEAPVEDEKPAAEPTTPEPVAVEPPTPALAKTTPKAAAKPVAKAPPKRVAATKKAPVRKVKKPVRKPVRRPATKTKAKPKKCTGLDCL